MRGPLRDGSGMQASEAARQAGMTFNWRDLVSSCDSEEAIVQVTREYLASWNPEELARIPEACRPGRIRDGEDITRWAFELASEHCSGEHQVAAEAVLVKMLVFLTEAAQRLAAVNHEPQPEGGVAH